MNREVELNRLARFLGPTEHVELKWRWNIENDDFDINFNTLEKTIETSKKLNDFNDFYSLLSDTSQSKLLTYVEAAMRGQSALPLKLDIINEESKKFPVSFKVEKKDRSFFEGKILFLVDQPAQGEIVNVLGQIFNNNHHGMVITDQQTQILSCNGYFERCSGYKLAELAGKKTSIFNANKHGELFFTEMWSQIHYYGFWSGMILSKRKSGAIEPQELTIQELQFSGKIYYLGITRDLSKSLYRLEGKEYGGIELLTQLPNKKSFLHQLESMRNDLVEPQSIVVLVIKLSSNEQGSDLEVTQELSSALSIGRANQLSGFLGAGIFSCAIIYEKSTDHQELGNVYQVIRGFIAQLRQKMSRQAYRELAQSTIGVSVLGVDTDHVLKMLPNALKAMYERHSNSGNHVCFYNSKMHHKFKRREKLERVIRSTISNKRVEVYYQPIFSTKDWSIDQFETLCRFRGANGEILNTGEVIEIATELALIQQLDLIVAQAALKDRQSLALLHGKQVGVSINVSLNTQQSVRSVLGNLVHLARDNINDACFLNIELTDYVDLDDPFVSKILDELVSLRVSLSLDDFLTGQSVFSHIRDGRFEYLKIEREFITDLTPRSGNYAILKSIISLAHDMGLKVIAKGVETISEVESLYQLKVDYMQGFYFSRPEPLEEIQPYSGYMRQLKEVKAVCFYKNERALITLATALQPGDTLGYVRELFESTPFSVLPVLNNKKCVGIIDREIYQRHLSPTLGTAIETTHDTRSLNKRVHQLMIPDLTCVGQDLTPKEMAQLVESGRTPPWIVVDANGDYTGVIEKDQLMRLFSECI